MKKLIKSVLATIILAALIFLNLRYVNVYVESAGTSIAVYGFILTFFSVLFGPVVGFIGGFLGNLLADLTAGWGIWWTWIVVTGIYGLFIGLGCKDVKPGESFYGKKDHLRLIVVSILSGILCWGVLAPLGDIVFYKEPAAKVFAQGLLIGAGAILSSVFLCPILLEIYSKIVSKKK